MFHNSVGQRIEAERRNAEEPLRNDEKLLATGMRSFIFFCRSHQRK
jgi:hypothetical protein